MLRTYEGVIRHGTVALPPGLRLPEGTRVHITVVPTLGERNARRKAARWLAENVGDMLMPGEATLSYADRRLTWRFQVMLGSPYREPRGPIGYLEVDANSGDVVASPSLAKELLVNVEHIEGTVLSSRD